MAKPCTKRCGMLGARARASERLERAIRALALHSLDKCPPDFIGTPYLNHWEYGVLFALRKHQFSEQIKEGGYPHILCTMNPQGSALGTSGLRLDLNRQGSYYNALPFDNRTGRTSTADRFVTSMGTLLLVSARPRGLPSQYFKWRICFDVIPAILGANASLGMPFAA